MRMRIGMVRQLLVATVAIAMLASCRGRGDSGEADRVAELRRREQRAAELSGERVCARPITVYEGSIAVNASDYVHPVERGEDFVDEPIGDLDRVVSKAAQVRFTLDYPFEKPFAGVVTRDITLRRTIDAIRAAFRTMYAGTTQRDIPGMHNKEVTGAYGTAIHVIDDLVIEQIDLCADDSLSIYIGS